MSQLDDFLNGVKGGITDLVKDLPAKLKKDATEDLMAFAKGQANDFKEWATSLKDGRIDREEFEFLVKGTKDLAELRALRLAGVQAARLQRLRDDAVDLVIKKATETFV